MATILIVDDRQANRDYLVALLGYGGHRLLQAADGADALATIRSDHPDLVIADILMPTMDGYELVRQLRADPLIAHTPVIFWTAHYHEREAQALARTCGVSSVITKPSEPDAVLSAVEAALGLKAPVESPRATPEFDREHLRLLTDKLSQKANDLRDTNDRLSALVELNLQFASELDITRLLQGLSHAARKIIGARYSITGILGGDGTQFQSMFTSGLDPATAARLGSPDPRAAVLNTILREGRCVRVHSPDVNSADLGFSAAQLPVRAWLGAPIASPTRIFGYIGLVDKIGVDTFSKEDERLAGILAAQVGRVYQNGSLYSDVVTHAAELEREMAARVQTEKALAERVRQGLLTGEVAAALTHSETLREMLQLCAEGLVRHLDAAFARIWTFNETENVLELKASAGLYTHINGPHGRIPLGKLKIGRIAQERKPHFTNQVLADPQVSDKEWAKRENLVAFAGYPLVVDERLLGVVGMFARHPLTTATEDAMASVADEIALGIERHRANEALREREEHIHLLLDSTAEAIYGIDIDGRCSFANAACARLLGYDHPSLLLGRDMHALMHHTRADGTPYPVSECKILLAFRRGVGSHIDDEVLWRADRSSFPAEYWSYPVRRDGQIVGSVVTFLDITERRKLERQYQQAQQRLRHAVVSSPSVLFTLAVEGEEFRGITWTSDNLEKVLGYPPEAAIAADWWMTSIHPEDKGRVMDRTRAELFARGHSIEEYRFRHADGQYRWTRSEIRLIRDEAGRPEEAVGAWSDITKWKLADQEQARLQEQLQQAQKLESVGRLAGGVAHDFNNLLTVINGYSSILLRQLAPSDPIYENIKEISTAGERAAALSRQLLVLSRKQVIEQKPVNLNDVVGEVEKMLGRVIGEDIRLESALSPTLGIVLADAGQMHQVLMNLAINARDAMPSGGTLLIETGNVDLDGSFAEHHAEVKPGRYIQLKVSDTGIGMTKEVMSHLFEPFFTTKKAGEGTGLGLATVYGIVKQSGGSVWVYSEPGEGTSFKIFLPRIESEAIAPDEPAPSAATLRGTETVLVVEDQEQLRKMVAGILRSQGYKVYEAANPGEALLQCERYAGPIHLLLTDIIMPGITGPELASRIKPLRPSMKVIFMSGYSERAMTDRRVLAAAGAFLSKPFSPDTLATKVREVLGAPRPAGTILVVDDEPGIRNFLRKVLTGVSYQVLEAENGRTAVQLVETSDVDLVIMDLAMPEQEGIETIQTLHRVRPQLKIIAISGQFAGPMLRAAELLGAQASLAKPIQPNELLDAVASVMISE